MSNDGQRVFVVFAGRHTRITVRPAQSKNGTRQVVRGVSTAPWPPPFRRHLSNVLVVMLGHPERLLTCQAPARTHLPATAGCKAGS